VVPEGVEEKWERIQTTLKDICENTLWLENNKKKEWISDSTWKMIERRNQIRVEFVQYMQEQGNKRSERKNMQP
jgi:predicted nucleotidyltransferase